MTSKEYRRKVQGFEESFRSIMDEIQRQIRGPRMIVFIDEYLFDLWQLIWENQFLFSEKEIQEIRGYIDRCLIAIWGIPKKEDIPQLVFVPQHPELN